MQTKKDLERHRRIKRKKMRRRLFSLLVFILTLIYLPAVWNWLFSSRIEIGSVNTANLEIKAPIKGVFVRKERILESPGSGIVIPGAEYGEKMAVRQKIASFVSSDMKDLVANYNRMQVEILQRVISAYENAGRFERKTWEEAIEKQIEKLTDHINSGDYNGVDSVKESIDDVLTARARDMLEDASLGTQFTAEREELERLKNSIERAETAVISPESGVVSYYCAGDEDMWLPENRNSITVADVDRVSEKEYPVQRWITPGEIEVKPGQSFGKLVTNDEAWVAFYVPAKQFEQVHSRFQKAKMEGRALELEIEVTGLNRRLPVSIEGFGESGGEYGMVIAHMTSFIELTMDMRGFSGNLVLNSYSGMKVPHESLFNKNSVDGTADIIIVDMNKARYRRVRIIAEQDSYAIIDNIESAAKDEQVNVFDIYVINPKNIEEGQVIEQ